MQGQGKSEGGEESESGGERKKDGEQRRGIGGEETEREERSRSGWVGGEVKRF